MILSYSIIAILNIFLFLFHNKLHNINYPIDHPGKRKIHSDGVLLSGGLFFFINLILFFIIKNIFGISFIEFSDKNIENLFLFSAITFFVLGFVDDKINLNANLKLLVIIFILCFFLGLNESLIIQILKFSFTDKTINLGNYSFIFTILCLSLFINAFNMYDGINLQSASYSLIFFIFFILNSYNIYFISMFIFSLILFMFKNFQSKSFLGDNGCYILSFIIGIFIIDIYKFEKIYSDQIFLLMMIPGIDMLRLFIIRILNKKNPFSGDKNHLHHILLRRFNQISVFKILFIIKLLILTAVLLKLNTVIVLFVTFIVYGILLKKLNFN